MTRPTDIRLALLVFLLLLCVYGLTNRGSVWSHDAVMRIGMAEQLLDRRAVGFPERLLPDLESHGGRVTWGLGHPIVLLPSVLAGRAVDAVLGPGSPRADTIAPLVVEFAATATNALIGALACALLFLTGRLLDFSPRVSVLGALGVGLATIWWPYTQDAFYEPLQGLCLLGAFHCALRMKTARQAWPAFVAGACLGMAVLTKISNLLMLAPILMLAWDAVADPQTRSASATGRTALAFLAGLAPFLAIQLWADWSHFGTPFPHPFVKNPKHAVLAHKGSVCTGIGAVLVGWEDGLLWYSPASLVALAWLGRLARRRRLATCALGLALAAGFLAAARLANTGLEGQTWGPRYLAPFIPLGGLLFLPWIEALEGRGNRVLRVATLCVFSLAVAVQLLATTIQAHRYHAQRERLPTAVASRFPHSSPLAQRPAELRHALATMASGDAWDLAGAAKGSGDESTLAVRARSLNILNYWWALAYYEGVPLTLLGAALLCLLVPAALAARALLRALRRE